jgi:anti-sigma factor RsiW
VEYPSGWTCELTVVKLELYLLGTLSRAEALAVADHLEACPGCTQRLVLWRPVRAGSTEGRGRRG